METLTVLYDDAHLVVCVKPAGILSEDDGSPRCMPQLLREHYRALGQSEEVFAVHRLDREVGGVWSTLAARPSRESSPALSPSGKWKRSTSPS